LSPFSETIFHHVKKIFSFGFFCANRDLSHNATFCVGMEYSYDDDDDDGGIFFPSPKPDLPQPVIATIERAKSIPRQQRSLLGIILYLLFLPLTIWTESAKGLAQLGHKATGFGFDMAVRKLHQRGLINRLVEKCCCRQK